MFKILTIISLGFVTATGLAQEHRGCHKHDKLSAQELLDKLDAKLNLNETQEKRVYTLLEKRMSQHKALREEMRTTRMSEKADIKQQLKTVLNEQQFQKLMALKEQRKSEFRQERCAKDRSSCSHNKQAFKNRKKPEERLEFLTKELDLNKEQQEALREIFKSKREAFKKKHPEFRTAKRQFKEDFERDMKSILSADQFKTFITLKEEHRMHKRKKTQIKH